MSSSDEAVIAAAEALGEALAQTKSETSPEQFEEKLVECNEAISAMTGVEYGDVCGAGTDCC